uniref:Uncharacterized protein n=1 Tax=Anguilla anguilla TaxID=7936 RepID=A0A0E9XVF1_ANGAN
MVHCFCDQPESLIFQAMSTVKSQ